MVINKQRFVQIIKEEISKRIIKEGKLEIYMYLSKSKALKQAVIQLLSEQYINFVQDIYITAPIPTTFCVVLNNDNKFLLIYQNKSFTAKISGKKYMLDNSGDLTRARTSLSELLTLSQSSIGKNEEMEFNPDADAPVGTTSGGSGLGEPPISSSTSVFQPLSEPSEPDDIS
jgi:hypothetical protein